MGTDTPNALNVPVSRKQAEFFALGEIKLKGFMGGRGSAKTVTCALDMWRRIKPNRHYLASAPTQSDLDKAVLRNLEYWGNKFGRIAWIKRAKGDQQIGTTDGSVIWLMSAETPDRFRGPDVSGWWADEFSLYDELTWQNGFPTLREAGEEGWFTASFTPMGQNWAYKIFPDGTLITASTYDNPFNPAGLADTWRSRMTSERARQEIFGEAYDYEGTKFRRHWLKYYGTARAGDQYLRGGDFAPLPFNQCQRYIFCDTAASSVEGIPKARQVMLPGEDRPVRKPGKRSWTVFQAWDLAPDRHVFKVDSYRKQVEIPDIINDLRAFIAKHNPITTYIETKGPSGIAVYQTAKREGLTVGALDPGAVGKDDWGRIGPLQVKMEHGQVWIPAAAPWLAAFVDELLYFPNGDYNDQVDTAAYMAKTLATEISMATGRGARPERPVDLSVSPVAAGANGVTRVAFPSRRLGGRVAGNWPGRRR